MNSSSSNHSLFLLYLVNSSKPLTLADAAEVVLLDRKMHANRWCQFLKPLSYSANPGATQEFRLDLNHKDLRLPDTFGQVVFVHRTMPFLYPRVFRDTNGAKCGMC